MDLIDYYWNPSKVPKDKRLKLLSAGKQEKKRHLKDKAQRHGLKYSTKKG